MALLSTQRASQAGVALTYGPATAAGDTFLNTGREYLHVKNGGGAPITVTVDAPNQCSFGVVDAAHDLAVSVGAGADKLIGPFSKDQFNDADGIVTVTYSDDTSVTVAVIG